MRLSFELSTKQDQDYAAAGLSQAEKFWLTENRLNLYCSRMIYFSLLVFSFFFNSMLLVVTFEVDLCTNIFFQTLNVAHTTFLVFTFLPSIYLVSLFVLNLMRFFVQRFRHIRKRIGRLNIATKQINRKLARLIGEHNRAHFDLTQMNDLFRHFLGVNFICFGAVGVLGAFNMISESIDWKIKIYISTATFALYATSIAIPFRFANSVTNAVIFFWIYSL